MALAIRQELAILEAELRRYASPERAAGEKRYLKSELTFLGVPLAKIRSTVRDWSRARGSIARSDLMRLSRSLWRRRVHELRAVAIVLLQSNRETLARQDFFTLEELLRDSHTWAYVDALAVHVVGPLVAREARLKRSLDRWSKDPDFWIRRSALLALLLPLRRGEMEEWDRFVTYADRMLDENEFFIRKAIGWVLREVGKKEPARVERFVEARLERISGLTLREAVRYLPPKTKSRLLAG